MTNFFKKNKVEMIVLLCLFLLYFFTRLYHILDLPIFTDEAIYIRWSQIAKQDAYWRFISLTDGKQPMFVWIAMIYLRFIEDPLLAVRLVSVTSGFLTMVGLFFLGKELFRNKWIGLLTAFLYVISPFTLVYDRMALYESMVSTWIIWGLYLAVLLVRHIRLDIAMIFGLIIGGGALTKTSAFFSAGLLPISLLLFDFKQKEWRHKILYWLLYAAIAFGLGVLYYSILHLSPFFHIIGEKNAIFVYPFNEWLQHPFTYFYDNVMRLWNWLYIYMTWTFIVLATLSFFLNKKFIREKILLFLWFFIPFLYLAFFGRTLYPRYLLFMILSLLPLMAYSLSNLFNLLKSRYVWVLIFLVSISFAVFADSKILTGFSKAPIPKPDLDQYVNDWPAGGGVKEAVEFFKQEAQDKKIYVATEGTFGLMPYSFEIYLITNPNITIHGFWPINDTPPIEALSAAKKMPVYFVFYQPCVPCQNSIETPVQWKVNAIHRYVKGIGKRYLTVYQLLP